MFTPLARQLFVAGSTYLAALSAGAAIGYPSVLLQQLQSNDTIIKLDLHRGSWIGSVHGFAGLPSILMPVLMQYTGRKYTFILSCILNIIGWALIYIAQNITILLIGESFHGLGGNSLLAVSFLSVSEMVHPKYRNACLSLFPAMQAFGVSSVGIIGQHLHWKTACLVMSSPMLLALLMGCIWPESPSWLAWKGKLEECQRSFVRLRGTGKKSRSELQLLISSQKESKVKMSTVQCLKKLGSTLIRKDFYMPAVSNIILLNVLYWCGGMPFIVYSADIILKATGKPHPHIQVIMNIMLSGGYFTTCILVRYISARKVMLTSMSGCMIIIASAAILTYLRGLGIVQNDSEIILYCLASFVLVMSLGANILGFNIASEVMPVKHRGLGGSLFVICTCVFHSSSLKAYPYLYLYFNIWGVFLIYAVYTMLSIIFIWKYVPETRDRTLQEIENYYNHGCIKEINGDDNVDVPFIK